MRLFSLKEEDVTYFAKKYAKYFGLNNQIAADLEVKILLCRNVWSSPNWTPNMIKDQEKEE